MVYYFAKKKRSMELLFNTNVQFFILAYLAGGIPFGLLLAKQFAGVDIKSSGSKSIGATNVLRVVKEQDPSLAKKLAIATIALDALKGVAVLLVAHLAGVSEATLWGIAVLAVVGHCFSPFLGFEGGKGVATGIGVVAFMLPLEALIALVFWAASAKLLKISSLSSLIGLGAMLVSSFLLHPEIPHAPLVLLSIIIIYKHLPNIARLLTAKEGKVA